MFSSSTQWWQIFKDNVSSCIVKSLQTRWESHVESVKSIRHQAPEIRAALIMLPNIGSSDNMAKSDVESIVVQIEKFKFLLSLCIWNTILYVVNVVSKYLQIEDMQIDVVITQLKKI